MSIRFGASPTPTSRFDTSWNRTSIWTFFAMGRGFEVNVLPLRMLVLLSDPKSGELATTLIEVIPVGARSALSGSDSWRASDPDCVHAAAVAMTIARAGTQILIRVWRSYQTTAPIHNLSDRLDLSRNVQIARSLKVIVVRSAS